MDSEQEVRMIMKQMNEPALQAVLQRLRDGEKATWLVPSENVAAVREVILKKQLVELCVEHHSA